jgi:hypothetical protein
MSMIDRLIGYERTKHGKRDLRALKKPGRVHLDIKQFKQLRNLGRVKNK